MRLWPAILIGVLVLTVGCGQSTRIVSLPVPGAADVAATGLCSGTISILVDDAAWVPGQKGKVIGALFVPRDAMPRTVEKQGANGEITREVYYEEVRYRALCNEHGEFYFTVPLPHTTLDLVALQIGLEGDVDGVPTTYFINIPVENISVSLEPGKAVYLGHLTAHVLTPEDADVRIVGGLPVYKPVGPVEISDNFMSFVNAARERIPGAFKEDAFIRPAKTP